MLHIRIEPYTSQHKQSWDEMIAHSRNGVFLFFRDYMEYHVNRFQDASLLFFDGNDLLAVLPANRNGDQVVSHGGLTFGGVISRHSLGASGMLELFDVLRIWLHGQGVSTLLYKPVPHIYHRVPAEEDLYALFRSGARLVRRDLSSTLDMASRSPMVHGRQSQLKRGQRIFVVRESRDYGIFMDLVSSVLNTKYKVEPTHTKQEMELLSGRFPQNIRLYGAYREEQLRAGVLVYESTNVAHAQYIAGDDEAKREGALECVFAELLERRYATIRYFDWGISTEQAGQWLNPGLVQNKESYGARGVVYDLYELDLA
jgi:Acetyltransferase (GNAT) domain